MVGTQLLNHTQEYSSVPTNVLKRVTVFKRYKHPDLFPDVPSMLSFINELQVPILSLMLSLIYELQAPILSLMLSLIYELQVPIL
jgi:hypothetical protein